MKKTTWDSSEAQWSEVIRMPIAGHCSVGGLETTDSGQFFMADIYDSMMTCYVNEMKGFAMVRVAWK